MTILAMVNALAAFGYPLNPCFRLILRWNDALSSGSYIIGQGYLGNLGADAVIVACGYQSPQLLPELRRILQSIRGQVEWGKRTDTHLPSASEITCPINGMGHFIHTPITWLTGATFQRDELDLTPRSKDADLNFKKLSALMPELGKADLSSLRGQSSSWVGMRLAQKNRLPLVQRIESKQHSNLWACTGLGARGLSLAPLCASQLLQVIFAH